MPSAILYFGSVSLETAARRAAKLASLEFRPIRNDEVPPDFSVLIVGSSLHDGITRARLILANNSAGQVLFLVGSDRLQAFRQSLPFTPKMASAWTADEATAPDVLADILKRAVEIAERRLSASTMRDQINARLTGRGDHREAQQAEETRLRQLAISENYLATVLSQAPDGLLAISPDGFITAWNASAARLFNIPAAAAIGTFLVDRLPGDIKEEVTHLLDLGRAGRSIHRQEMSLRVGGRKLWLDVSLAPVRGLDDQVISLSITIHDVTERKTIEQQLRLSEERYRTLTETLPQLVWACGADGLCEYFSRQWVDYTGIPAEQQLGLAWLDLVIHPADRDRTREHWFGAVAGDHPYDIDYRIRRADGVYRWFKTRATAIHAEDGSISQWFGTCTDIENDVEARLGLKRATEQLELRVEEEVNKRNQSEEALRQAQKMESLGQLTGGVAHDFNNLLQVVSGNLQLLTKDVEGNERAKRRIDNALAGVSRGSKLASQLLAFGRRQALEPKVVNIGRLVSAMGDMLRRTIGETVEVEIVRGGGLWNCFVDPAQIENVILNLAINARDAMDGIGKLTVEVANTALDDAYARRHAEVKAGQYVMLAVTDTGSGMSSEVLSQVFEPFFSTKPVGKGTGLGLSMVYGFVKQSDGHIKIYSEVGQGSTIRIYLPRVSRTEDVPVPVDAGPLIGGSEVVLVAEDDEDVRTTVVEMLRDLGYRVLTARDAASALTVIESGVPIDLLFTDVVMPGPLRSPELARMARERIPGIGVLFTSGYTENSIVHDGKLDQGVDLLSKPYTRDHLARKIRLVLNNQRQRNEAMNARRSSELRETKQLTILLVEDDGLIRMNVAETLADMGHIVEEAESGEKALGLLEESHAIDLIITDLGLPGMSGGEFAKEVRRINPAMPIAFATGNDTAPFLPGSGLTLLLRKPFSDKELRSAVERINK